MSCVSLAKSFGAQRLFDSITFAVHSSDRIGIIGPNGSGKSTLLKILCGKEEVDSGEIRYAKFCRTGYLAQENRFLEEKSVTENLFHCLDGSALEETEKYTRIHTLLSRAEFADNGEPVEQLSGGWRKRLAICQVMVTEPDVLILDEPTNHLDIEGILWLEKMLAGMERSSAYIVVSHDRRFLENCTNRMIEISAVYPEGSLQVDGNYSTFLEAREEFLAAQEEEEARLANRAKREVEWLRRGPKARATKAKYRIDEAYKLQDDLQEVRTRNRVLSEVQIDFSSTGRKTKKLLDMEGVSKGYDGRTLFGDLDLVLSPGSRLGLLGRNGCGKSTLMKILAGAGGNGGDDEVLPDSGVIRTADKVKIVHFDQKRESLDLELTLRRALAPDGDSVVFRDRSLHVVSWAKKFLFRPEQLETPVGQLSGGERARICIADLMRQPADILLLDEPTNDLDIPSLNVLETSLLEFAGALVLVTHDRFLLDRVCDKVLGFGESGVQFFADYEQWLLANQKSEEAKDSESGQRDAKEEKRAKKDGAGKKGKLSYLDQREYDQLEEKITDAEREVERLEGRMLLPEVIADAGELETCWQKLEKAKEEVNSLYARWEELEEKKSEGE